MTSISTPDGFEADIVEGGDGSLQVLCDILNRTHFEGGLPPIAVFAASRIKHPHQDVVHAITFKTEQFPILRGLNTDWLILIHEAYCQLPFLAQLLLHEMTHVSLPDQAPYHSAEFWATLRNKWSIDLNLLMGVGLNGDEEKSGLTKEFLDATAFHRLLGI